MNWTRGRSVHFPEEYSDLAEYFQDFLLGLTFPQAVVFEDSGERRRGAFTVLSATWQFLKLQNAKCAFANSR